jgi:hypothetical protein
MPLFDPAVAGQGGLDVPGANPWGGLERQLPDAFFGDALVLTDCVGHSSSQIVTYPHLGIMTML